MTLLPIKANLTATYLQYLPLLLLQGNDATSHPQQPRFRGDTSHSYLHVYLSSHTPLDSFTIKESFQHLLLWPGKDEEKEASDHRRVLRGTAMC